MKEQEPKSRETVFVKNHRNDFLDIDEWRLDDKNYFVGCLSKCGMCVESDTYEGCLNELLKSASVYIQNVRKGNNKKPSEIERVSGETPKPDWNSKLFQANVENSSLQMELEAEQDKSEKAIDLIRSALAIAKRRGAETYWDGFQMQCENILKGSKPIDKVSGEAKTPDLTVGEKMVVDQAIKYLDDSLEPFHANTVRLLLRKLTGGSVPTPSDEEKIDVRIGMQLFLRKYKTGEEETAFIQGVRFGRGSAEQEKQQKS